MKTKLQIISRFSFTMGLWIGTALSLAQPANPARSLPSDTKTLTLRVIDAKTEEGLSGATIHLYGGMMTANKPAKSSTDSTGKATVSVPPMSGPQFWLSLTASHPDYASKAINWSTYMQDNATNLPVEYTLKLDKGITIGGTVKDEAGLPVKSGKVFLNVFYNTQQPQRETPVMPPAEDFKLGSQFSHFEMTDENGHWKCPHLPQLGGTVSLRAARPDGSFANFITSRPEYQGLSPRTTLIQMDDLLAANATLVLKQGITVNGIVIDSAGRPIKGAHVSEGYGMHNIDVAFRNTTGEDGRFKLQNRVKREMILTVQAEGYAITSTVVPVEPGIPEVRTQLPAQRPLRGRVLNGEGEPIAGAEVRVDPYSTKAQILDWESKTDDQGRFQWPAAPQQPVVFSVTSSNYPLRKVTLVSTNTEHLIRIRKENKDLIQISGKVLEAETKQPIERFTVNTAQEYGGPRLSVEGNKGEFTLDIRPSDFGQQGYYPGFKLRILAEGYAPFVTGQMEFPEGDRTLEISLKKGGAATLAGIIRLPNGEPAADAKVLLTTASDRNYGPPYSHQPGEFYKRETDVTAKADADGRFALPPTANEIKNLVVTHADGFVALTAEEFRSATEIKLQPWGRIEGSVRIGSKSGSHERILLHNSAYWSPDQAFQFHYNTQADDEGKFVFEKLPPGECQLYRAQGIQRPGPTVFSHQIPVSIKAGETTKLTYGGTGRPVIGRVEPTEWISTIDWQWDNHVLKLKTKAAEPDSSQPFWEDFATQESFEKAQKAYKGPRNPDQSAQQYKLQFDTDGSFRVEDVPAGDYELVIRVTEPSKDPNARYMWRPDQVKEIGSIKQDVAMPLMPGGRTDEPLDLGVLELKVSAPVGNLQPVSALEVKTVDGQPLKLAEYRGKFVVLAFWGAWSDACKRDLPALKAAYETFAKDPRFAMISLSLDENAEVPKQFAAANDLRWTQGYLDDEAKVKVTDSFDVSTLPAIFLVNPEGKIISRDLRAQGVQKSVERALRKK